MLYEDKKVKANSKSSLDSKARDYIYERSDYEVKKWWSNEKEVDADDYTEFLKDKEKVSEVISPRLKKSTDKNVEKLVDLNTSYGVLSIGANKYKDDEELFLTILPKSENDKINVQEKDPFDDDTYLNNIDESLDDFEVSDKSFIYDFKKDKIDRIDEDVNEDELDEEDELLYKDDEENEKIEELLKQKNNLKSRDNDFLEEEINDVVNVKEQKRKENIEFFEEIKSIINAIGKGKIQKIVESDDAISRRNRIYSMSENNLLIEELKFLLKKIQEIEDVKTYLKDIKNDKIRLLSREQLKELILKLKSLEKISQN